MKRKVFVLKCCGSKLYKSERCRCKEIKIIQRFIKSKIYNKSNIDDTTQIVSHMKPCKSESQYIESIYNKFSFRKGYKDLLFNQIKSKTCQNIKDISDIKTTNGDTQSSERLSIKLIEDILVDMNLNYTLAGSQQSKDFRNVYKNVKSLCINVEIKKTNSTTIYFNDTLPSTDIYYIIFVTGKEYKKNTINNIQQQIIFINGYDLIKDDLELLMEYKEDIEYLKNKWARKKSNNKANSFKNFSVYPRPTFKTDIKYLLNSPQSFVLGEVEQHYQSE